MRTCPVCARLSPDASVLCDCGYAFDEALAATARAAGFVPGRPRPDKTERRRGLAQAFTLLGLVLGSLPSTLVMLRGLQASLRETLADHSAVLWLPGPAGYVIATLVLARVRGHRPLAAVAGASMMVGPALFLHWLTSSLHGGEAIVAGMFLLGAICFVSIVAGLILGREPRASQ